MPFNPISFLISQFMLRSQGVDSTKAIRISIISSFMSPAEGLVIAAVLGRQETSKPVVLQPPIPEKEIPHVKRIDAKETKKILIDEGFTNISYDPSSCRVCEVSPPEGEKVPINTQINLNIVPTGQYENCSREQGEHEGGAGNVQVADPSPAEFQ